MPQEMRLTSRELQILSMIADGLTDKEIAVRMFRDVSRRLARELGVQIRREMMR